MFLLTLRIISYRSLLRISPQLLYIALLTYLLAIAAKADASQLLLLLAPTAEILEWLAGFDFYFVDSEGYQDYRAGITIAPECAGLRFFVLASVVGLSCKCRQTSFSSNLIHSVTILVLSFITTIIANVVRIFSIILLAEGTKSIGHAPVSELHLFLGSVTYFFFLAIFAVTIRGVSHDKIERTFSVT